MSNYICPQCGHPVEGTESKCPECGVSFVGSSETLNPPFPLFAFRQKTDWANYIYECWTIAWYSFTRMFKFKGRASRREFWSYSIFCSLLGIIPVLGGIIWLIGFIAVAIRRLHDIDKCGWWILLPFWPFFWYLKKSDLSYNRYGEPFPAKSLLD